MYTKIHFKAVNMLLKSVDREIVKLLLALFKIKRCEV